MEKVPQHSHQLNRVQAVDRRQCHHCQLLIYRKLAVKRKEEQIPWKVGPQLRAFQSEEKCH